MKALLCCIAMLGTTTGWAEPFLEPINLQGPLTLSYDKGEAEDLWDSLDVPEQRGNSLKTTMSMVKILRAGDGKFEIACVQTRSKIRGRGIISTSCTLKVSTNGGQVPRFKLRRRIG